MVRTFSGGGVPNNPGIVGTTQPNILEIQKGNRTEIPGKKFPKIFDVPITFLGAFHSNKNSGLEFPEISSDV